MYTEAKKTRYLKEAKKYLAKNPEASVKRIGGYLDCNIIPVCSMSTDQWKELVQAIEQLHTEFNNQLNLFK